MSGRLRVVLVSGLSGSGKSSILRALEDLGYEAVDNPPLALIEDLVGRSAKPLAIGVDARTRGFDAGAVLQVLERLRLNPTLRPELVYAWAEEAALLRRYTETRRRHPLAPHGRVADGVAQEQRLLSLLRQAADLVLDTTSLSLSSLRRLIEQHFVGPADGDASMVLTLISFAYSAGLPLDADLVFDARFLRNPHYDPILRPCTGLDPAVGAYIEADPDFAPLLDAIRGLVSLVLPRFIQEGKKYATIAIGCTGGRHRSVHLIEKLAATLSAAGWRPYVIHRELAPHGPAADTTTRPESTRVDQAQEA
jgi:RNase adapter protein RapZ